MNVIRNIFSFNCWLNIYVLIRFEWSGAVRITKPLFMDYKNGSGYLQIANRKPPKYFAIKMQSGRYGIMRTTECASYSDFSCPCYSVSFRSTEFYDRGVKC